MRLTPLVERFDGRSVEMLEEIGVEKRKYGDAGRCKLIGIGNCAETDEEIEARFRVEVTS